MERIPYCSRRFTVTVARFLNSSWESIDCRKPSNIEANERSLSSTSITSIMSTTNFCRLVEERKASARLYSWHKKQQFVQHLASSSLSIFPLGNEVCRMTFVKCYLECGMFQIIHEIFNFKFFSIFHGGVWCEWISLISFGNTNSDKFCNTTSSACNRN